MMVVVVDDGHRTTAKRGEFFFVSGGMLQEQSWTFLLRVCLQRRFGAAAKAVMSAMNHQVSSSGQFFVCEHSTAIYSFNTSY